MTMWFQTIAMKGYRPSQHPDATGQPRAVKKVDGRKNPHPNHNTRGKLTEEQVFWIRANWQGNNGKLNMQAMADKFGVRRQAISLICNRKTWRNI